MRELACCRGGGDGAGLDVTFSAVSVAPGGRDAIAVARSCVTGRPSMKKRRGSFMLPEPPVLLRSWQRISLSWGAAVCFIGTSRREDCQSRCTNCNGVYAWATCVNVCPRAPSRLRPT